MSESITFQRKGKLTDAEASLKPWLISKGIDPKSASREAGESLGKKTGSLSRSARDDRMLYFASGAEIRRLSRGIAVGHQLELCPVEEAYVNLFYADHYPTETFGVKALARTLCIASIGAGLRVYRSPE